MKTPFLLCLLSAALFSCSENQEKVEPPQIEEKEQEMYGGVPISEEEPDNYTGEYIELYQNDLPKMRGQKVNGVREGKWESFHPTGARASEGTYVNGKEHGFYTVYFDNGQIRHKGRYDMGKQVGKWKFYSEEGELILDTIFNP